MANRAEITTNSIVGVNYIIMNEALNALWTSIKKKKRSINANRTVIWFTYKSISHLGFSRSDCLLISNLNILEGTKCEPTNLLPHRFQTFVHHRGRF